MDFIGLEVKFETLQDNAIPELAMKVAVNGVVLASDFSIDILALYNSTQESGEHFIWTCSCGIPECAGIYRGVLVSYLEDSVLWQAPKIPFEQVARFEFVKTAYITSVMEGLHEYIRYFKSYRATGIEFDSVPHWQMDEVLAKISNRKFR